MNSTSNRIILWEAHRGGGGGFEMPESCPLSFEYGWLLGGRPEADVNLTADGVMVSVHDPTLDRIVRDLPEELKGKAVSDLTWQQIKDCETGWQEYPGQHIPTLTQLFRRLQEFPDRHMIIDYKRVPLELLAGQITEYQVGSQITFASWDRNLCRKMKELVPEIRTKNWLGGSAEQIQTSFEILEKEKFQDITEVQLHLNDAEICDPWRYQLSPEFVTYALHTTQAAQVLLQTLPWKFERQDLFRILDLGVRSFAVDFPNKFQKLCAEYFANQWS